MGPGSGAQAASARQESREAPAGAAAAPVALANHGKWFSGSIDRLRSSRAADLRVYSCGASRWGCNLGYMKKRSGGASGEAARRAAAAVRPESMARRAAERGRWLVGQACAAQAVAVESERQRAEAIGRRNEWVAMLRESGWSRSAVARSLGVSRQALVWPSGLVDVLEVEWGPG